MKIGIDIDEVIIEFMKGFFEFYEKEKGIKFNWNNLFDYYLAEPLEISLEESIELIREFNVSNYFDKLDFVKEAKESILNLKRKNKIFFITARHKEVKEKTEQFLKEHFGIFEFSLVFSGDVWQGQNKTKEEICKEKEIGILLEDNPKYSFNCAKQGIKVILFNKPWNQNCKEHKNIFRVNNWRGGS